MDNWKIQLVAVTFVALVQTYQGLTCSAEEERELSKDWQDETGLTDSVIDLMKRSKALRFYGLMGKRSGNKGETFVGLMGRSVSSDESSTRQIPAGTTTEKPHRQGSQDEWIQILY
ncbi:unnamed protein product [Ophioblennius macclurei]